MSVYNFFDHVEDKVRSRLSRAPILYALIGGTAIVLFWRGVWHLADIFEQSGGIFQMIFNAPVSLVISVILLLLSGLFVSFFIGDRIILSGITHEKKIEEKTETEVRAEGVLLVDIYKKLEKIEKRMDEMKKS